VLPPVALLSLLPPVARLDTIFLKILPGGK
jgi:hypothetical protein